MELTTTPYVSQKIVDMFIESMTMSECEKRVVFVEKNDSFNSDRSSVYKYVSQKKMCGAVVCMFDLSSDFVADLANLGKLFYQPFHNTGTSFIPNYCQYVGDNRFDGHDNIYNILHHLTKEKHRTEFDAFQRLQLRAIYSRYGTADAYFEKVSERLWQEKDHLSRNYNDELVLLRKRLLELRYIKD